MTATITRTRRPTSGHADREELLRWVGSAPEPPRVAFLVHGEPRSAAALAREQRRRYDLRTFTPELDEEVDLWGLLGPELP